MRVLTHDELPSEAESQVHLLDLAAGWGAMDFRRISMARKIGYPAAEYFGVYAVEGKEVLAMVRVLRLPYTTREGVEQVAAIQGVVTRRDRQRRGLARTLMEEVHGREKEAGSSLSLLWTGRGQVAHGLYESLGYVDVYTPELAVLHCPRKLMKPKRYELKRVRSEDVGRIEKLHAAATKGRLGFTPRHPGLVPPLLKLGFITLNSLRLIARDSEPVGYALIQKSLGWPRLDELVTLDKADPSEVVSLFESEAPGGWLAIRNTAVRDHLETLRRRRYSISHLANYGLLALALDRRYSDVPGVLGTASGSFTCQMLDYF